MRKRLMMLAIGLFIAQLALNAQNAQGRKQLNQCKKQNTQSGYVDKNNNQVCDNYENRTKGNQTGILNRKGNGKGRRAGNRSCIRQK